MTKPRPAYIRSGMHPHAGKPDLDTGKYAHPADIGTEHERCSESYFYVLGERDRWESRFYERDSKLYATRWVLVAVVIALILVVVL